MSISHLKQVLTDKGLQASEADNVCSEAVEDAQRNAQDYFSDIRTAQQRVYRKRVVRLVEEQIQAMVFAIGSRNVKKGFAMTPKKAEDLLRITRQSVISELHKAVRETAVELDDLGPGDLFDAHMVGPRVSKRSQIDERRHGGGENQSN